MDKKEKEKEKEKYNYTPIIVFSILAIIGGLCLWFFYIKHLHSSYDSKAKDLAYNQDPRNAMSTHNRRFFEEHGLLKKLGIK